MITENDINQMNHYDNESQDDNPYFIADFTQKYALSYGGKIPSSCFKVVSEVEIMSKITSLADYVRTSRKKHGLNQEELAQLAGVSLKSVENIESGKHTNTTIETFLRLITVLSATTPKKIPVGMEWDRLPLLTESLVKLAGFDDQSIRLFNETFETYISLMKKAKNFE